MHKYCYKHKNKKIKKLSQKLLVINEVFKDKILNNYMELCRSRHCVMFAKWRLNQLNYKKPPTGNKKKKSNNIKIELDGEISYLLELFRFRANKAAKISKPVQKF